VSLARVVDAFAAHLAAAMADPPAVIGAMRPTRTADLPAVTLSIRAVDQKLVSIGGRPAPSRKGSLPVGQEFDLTDPTVTFPDGETVNLLSVDRRSLHFPFGPVVAADGAEVDSLGPDDLTISIEGAALPIVAPDPGSGQASGIPALGEVRFGSPVPVTGSLRVDFFIGEWEVRTARYQGELIVEAADDDAVVVEDLSADVEATLLAADASTFAGLRALRPLSLGPVVADPGIAQGRLRELVCAFDFELEEATLGTGGGVIGAVAVDSTYGAEVFEVPAEAP
jgi:hypothetical protein